MQVRIRNRVKSFRTVAYDHRCNAVVLIDQRLLPHEFRTIALRDYRETARAIRDMAVRGAGAIAAAAAYGLAQGAAAFDGARPSSFERHIERVYRALASARPTAVDPLHAMDQVRQAMRSGQDVPSQKALARAAAEQFASDQVAECEALGRHGIPLVHEGARILTHCNAGALAFVDIGSATAPLYAASGAGLHFHVYCDETRPRCQGAALTAWELFQHGIPHTVIADNAAGHLMRQGEIDLVLVGSDRVLGRTGEVANKIGTYTKAVLARHHGLPFYVAIPLSTLDWDTRSGKDIPIEERSADEVLGAWGRPRGGRATYVRIANPGSSARNPGFDVTPPDLITGILTPRGVFRPRDLWPNRHKLA